jgi:hypothetical protein
MAEKEKHHDEEKNISWRVGDSGKFPACREYPRFLSAGSERRSHPRADQSILS